MKKRLLGCVAVAMALVVVGCGDSDDGKPELKVSAAASLKTAFTEYAEQFDEADVKLSFAGSDELAAQIAQGAPIDVFAAANTKLPDQLHAKNLVDTPLPFATNELVIAVPADSDEIGSIDDLDDDDVKIAAGSKSVPVGSYTHNMLDKLPPSQAQAIEGNIRSNEPDVSSVAAKVSGGAVDAGFVYITDVKASKGELKAVKLPANLEPTVVYGIAAATASEHPTEAKHFIDGVLDGEGQRDLIEAGFGPAPVEL